MKKNEKGFSLAEVMVAAGILGGMALAFTHMMKNMANAQTFAESKFDEMELKSSINSIISNSKHCRVSLAGIGDPGNPTNPVTFHKKDIDNLDAEGLDIELYLADSTGTSRKVKKYNGENNVRGADRSKYGKLKIKSMKLVMNSVMRRTGWTSRKNYPDSSYHTDSGVIRVIIDKPIAIGKRRELIFDFDVNLEMATGQSPETSSETRILGCSGNSAGSKKLVKKEKINLTAIRSSSSTQCTHISGQSHVSCREEVDNIRWEYCFLSETGVQDRFFSGGRAGSIKSQHCSAVQNSNNTWRLTAYMIFDYPVDHDDAVSCTFLCYNFE